MEWEITAVEKIADVLVVTAQVEISLEEFQDLIKHKFSLADIRIQKNESKEVEKPRKRKKSLSMTPKAIYQREWARKRRERTEAKKGGEIRGERRAGCDLWQGEKKGFQQRQICKGARVNG